MYLRTFTPRRWRRTIRAHSLLEEQTMEVGIEFVLYMVGMARLLVVFLKKIRKSRKRQAKSWERTVRPVVNSTLDKTSDVRLSRFFLLQTDRLQLTAVYCNRRGGVRTTPQRTRFRDVQHAIIMATVWIDDDTITSRKLGITFAWWNRTTRRPTPMTTWKRRPTQSTWNSTPEWMCT